MDKKAYRIWLAIIKGQAEHSRNPAGKSFLDSAQAVVKALDSAGFRIVRKQGLVPWNDSKPSTDKKA